MVNISLVVNGMSCQHCVRAIEQTLGEIKGVDEVSVELEMKKVGVSFDEQLVKLEEIIAAIQDEGYEVVKQRSVMA